MSICHTALPRQEMENRNKLWLIAAIMPALVAPCWLASENFVPASIQSVSGLVLMLLLACTTLTDLKSRKIYNWASYTACVWGLLINLLPPPISSGSIGVASSLSGLLGCFAVMLVPYILARGGAGDVKLAAAIGALVGFGDGMLVIAFSYIFAATLIIGWTIIRKGPFFLVSAMIQKVGFFCLPSRFAAPDSDQTMLLTKPIPLAGFFAIGTLFVVFDGPALLRSIS